MPKVTFYGGLYISYFLTIPKSLFCDLRGEGWRSLRNHNFIIRNIN